MEISCHDLCPQSASIATSTSRPVNQLALPGSRLLGFGRAAGSMDDRKCL